VEVATILQSVVSLEVLNIDNNSIYGYGVKMLGTALMHNKSLKELYMCSNNHRGDEESSAVASSLSHNTTLQVLHMICDAKGATAFAKALPTNSTLKKLSLWLFNDVSELLSEESPIKIIKSLHNNDTLVELGLPDELAKKDNVRI